ncbi:hypothetical protein OIU77_008051 [Salix suchowensis]|uniref:Uncharacterized protein n=1 Tax=Salix suchowensis TaxID=1278906 RepID=A0ABQ9AI62_9ROSI|nr:hypothetical protein OIU77_008051 [Salix suchowensis]
MVARLMLSLVQHQHPILTTVFFVVLIILVSTSCGADSDNKDYTDCNKPFELWTLATAFLPFLGRLMTLRLEKSQQYICPTQIQATNSSSGSRGQPYFRIRPEPSKPQLALQLHNI